MDEYEYTLLARLTRPKRPGLVRITYAMLELERGAVQCKASLALVSLAIMRRAFLCVRSAHSGPPPRRKATHF